MKVTLYTPNYPPQTQAAAIRSFWVAKTLRNAGHEVKILSSIETPESKATYFSPVDNKQKFLKRLIYEILTGIELFFRLLVDGSDRVILSSPPFITICIAHLACRMRATKYILDIRDIYPDIYIAQGLIKEDCLTGTLIKFFTMKMYQHAHAVVTVTPSLVSKIKTLSPQAKNVALLMNGYDSEIFKPSTEKYEKFTVVFHGTMGLIQDIPTILRVAEDLKNHSDIEFLFIGEGPQAQAIQNCNLKNVKYVGSKSYTEIPKLIAQAHVGFSARRNDEIGSDAFPVKVFEYIGVGLPVILTPASGVMTKLIGDGIYEFKNDQIKEISAKILSIKENHKSVQVTQDFSRQENSKVILKFIS